MNTNIIIGIILAIVAGAVGYFFFMGQAETPGVSEEKQEKNASAGQTFAQLLGMGQSLECTYEYNDGPNVSSGTMYMTNGGGKIRGDFNVTQSGIGAMQMHMVRIDGYNYLWGSAMPQGMKMRVTEETKAELFGGTEDPNARAINNTTYSCTSWREDASQFEIPADVQFTDVSGMMESMKKMMGAPKIGEATGSIDANASTDIKAMQCAACDQAGPARDQCREALGCQ